MKRIVLACLLVPAASAAAAPHPDLTVARPPWTPSLRMRPQAVAQSVPDPAPEAPEAAAPPSVDPIRLPPPPRRRDDMLDPDDRDLDEQLSFRFDVGFGLDGGEPSGQPLLSGAQLPLEQYARVRMYGYGDAVIGTRGLAAPSLSTYAAASFRIDHVADRPITAVPSVFDATGVDEVMVRAAHAELDEYFENPWLRPLYLRAGRQFRYGPAIAHFDGATVGYETGVLSVGLFSGYRVSLYGHTDRASDEAISGGDLRLDLYRLRRVPLVLTASFLDFDDSTHSDLGVALQWSRDVLLRGSVRSRNGNIARQRLELRLRVSQVTVVSAELDNRTGDDWIYDLLIAAPDANGDARRYLDLGPPLPRLVVGVRAGTVLLRNIDVLVRGGAAVEHDDELDTAWSPDYLEGGGALEVRVQRSIAVGTSVLVRRFGRGDPIPVGDETPGPDPLPGTLLPGIGERSFVETGGRLEYRQGARKFRAGAELYGRFYRFDTPYLPERSEDFDLIGGARFHVEGWAGERLRLRAEYDLSSAIAAAPELRGIKSLRVLAEGRF